MPTIELNGKYYAIEGEVQQTYLTRLASAYRPRGVQIRLDDTSVNRYPHRRWPLGIGWSTMNRETGRGVGGMLDSTCWTALGPTTLAKLQETQTHASPADHFRKAVNFKSDLWGAFEQNYASGAFECAVVSKWGATSDTWGATDTCLYNASSNGTEVSGTSLTVSHTVQSTYGNRIVVAFVHWRVAAGNAPSGVTYAGTAMTQLSSVVHSNGNQGTSFWYLVAPTTGTNNCVASGLAATSKIVMEVADYYFVNQSTPFGTAVTGSGSDTSVSLSITTTAGDQTIGGVEHNANEATAVGALQTERQDVAGANISTEYSEERSTSTTTTWSASWNTSSTFTAVSAPLLAAGFVAAREVTTAEGSRIWDMAAHKLSLFILFSGETREVGTSEVVYKIFSSTDGDAWVDASGTGWPDNTGTNRYLTTTITRRNNFDDDMGRLLSWGNSLVAAIFRHGSSSDGNGTIEVLTSTDSGTNWTSRVTIPSADGPKALVDFLTLGNVRSPVLVTAEAVYSIDIVNNTYSVIYLLDGSVNTGRWSEVGNDGALYVGTSSGKILRIAITDTNVMNVIVVGPPGDGLVTARQGYVNYMLKVSNEFLMVAYGGSAASKNASIFMIDTSVLLKDPETDKAFMPWHHMYQNATANLDIIGMAFSTEDDNTERLHFSVEGTSASVCSHIEEPFVNPDQSTTVKYQASNVSFIRLPVDDLGDPQTNAVITQGLVAANALSATTSGEYIQHQYGLDGAADTTTTLGNYLSGTLALSFGTGAAGVAAKTIGNRLNFFRGSTNTNTPKLLEWELQAHNLLLGRRAWTFTIDIAKTVAMMPPTVVANTPPEETVITNLLTAATATTLVTFTIGRMTQTRVRVPNDNPPIFHFDIVNSTAQQLGQRTGTCTIRVEEGI